MKTIGSRLWGSRWEYLLLSPFFLVLLVEALFSPNVIPVEPDGARTHTYFQLTGSTMIWLFILVPIGTIVVLGLLDVFDRIELGYRILSSLAFIAMVGWLASSVENCLNFHLDTSRADLHNVTVQETSVVRWTQRRGSDVYPLFVTVLTPEGKTIKFKAIRSVNRYSPPTVKTVSFTFGHGFFGHAYVSHIEVH